MGSSGIGAREAVGDGTAGGDVRRPLEALLGVPFTDGNEVQVLRNGVETFPVLLGAIRTATRSVDLLWFAWKSDAGITDEVTEALAERAAAGVRVRVLLDGFGGRRISRAHLARLRGAGCAVRFYRPLRTWRVTVVNARSHRRVLVCDEEVALTGGTGMASTWCGDARHPGEWRDTAVLVRGPAVAGLRAAFATDWLQTSEPLIGDADRFPPVAAAGRSAVQVLRASSAPGWNESAVAVLALLQMAQQRVRITTPYVRLPARLHDLLAATVRRGVQVQLLVCGPHVDRPLVHLQGEHGYQRLLDSGVEIWRYQPTLLHAKTMTVDGRIGVVGTVNLDMRSLTLNEQTALIVDDPAVAAVLDRQIDEDLDRCVRVLDRDWRARGLRRRVLEAAANAVAAPVRGIGGAGLTGRRP
ncbi:phospholipase D-like domain-containing protein [Pseudonocardia nigra]|uniref:phospholipase D-like domain-containing protein n=1 Tax=Pseudonocardia nigra TaxID=1921578 RepID=UPI001C5FAC48|nr:phospholipase D-like domain-containing protein [Pseudonocardia nigra]